MKAEWHVSSLDQLGITQTGSTPKASDKESLGTHIPFIKPGDFNENGSLNYDHFGLSERGVGRARRIRAGSVLMVCIGATIGKCGFSERDVVTNQQINSLTPKEDLCAKFAYYQMLTEDFQRRVLQSSGQATLPIINKAKWIGLTIAFPPRAEQQRIVGILDEAFEGIATAKANAEKNLQNARALFESHLQSIFTQGGQEWRERPLSSLASFRNGINYTKESKGELVKIVGVRNFQNHFSAPLDDLNTVTVNGQLAESDSLRRNDILVVRSNGNIQLIGRCILVGDVKEKTSHSGFTIRIRLCSNEVLPKYLCHFMKSAGSRKLLVDGGTGTNIKSLNQGMLSALSVPLPTVVVQEHLVKMLEALSQECQRLEAIYQLELVALEALQKSLLHQAFAGEL